MKRSKALSYIYPVLLTLGLGLILLSSKLILRKSTEIDQSKAVCDLAAFSIQSPTGYSFSNGCSEDAASIYTDDQRFTYFWLSEHLKNIPVVRTGNIREKDDKNLSWNISINKPSLTYIFYRKIPGQVVPSWISDGYTKSTLNDFTDLTLFAKRKNSDGLIGLYDVYMTDLSKIQGQTINNLGITGTVHFGPASTETTAAYSMYIVGVVPIQ